MKLITQTERKIIEFLDSRDKNLLDGTALPHRVIFIDQLDVGFLREALTNLAVEYGIIAKA